MYRFRFFLFAILLLCLSGAQTASAQPQPWTISTYQGDGQLICIGCNVLTLPGINSVILQQFGPLYAKVTDASGNPVNGASVIWNVSSGGQFLNIPDVTTTTTDASGLTHIRFTAPFTQASTGGPAQSTVTAYPATNPNSVATFTLSQTSLSLTSNTTQLNLDFSQAPITGTAFSGSSGSSGTPITIGVFAAGNSLLGGLTGPLAGISLKLINYQSNATVTCAQGSGADPGSVLTDSTGFATCTPVFSGNGRGQFAVVIGGEMLTAAQYSDGIPVPAAIPYVGPPPATSSSDPQPYYAGYTVTAAYNLNVIAATVASVQLVSGNNQSANSGQSLAAPLVAVVRDTNNSPVLNQAVTWTVTPANAATLSNTSTATDGNGQVRTNLTFASNASGTVTVTVTAAGKSASFTANAVIPVTITGIQKLSGDTQSAIQNAVFANPVVVQVNASNGQAAANQTVTFSVSGPATLSASSATTDANGRAQVSVTAGGTPGAVTVTATSGGFSTNFSLTVTAPGPQLTPSSFVNGADFQGGSISPCSIATIIAPGVAPNVQGVVTSNPLGVGFLGYTVAGDTVTVGGAQAPIYNVANVNNQQQVTIQVPCSVTPGGNVPVTVNVNGGTATINVTVLPASPGIFLTQNNVSVPIFGNLPLAVIMKRDGTFVTPQNPARKGEPVIAFVTGLGAMAPSLASNSLPIFGTPSTATGKLVVGVNNSGVPVTFAQASEDLIGVSLVSFTIPADAASGNVVFSIGVQPVGDPRVYYSNASAIYIQ